MCTIDVTGMQEPTSCWQKNFFKDFRKYAAVRRLYMTKASHTHGDCSIASNLKLFMSSFKSHVSNANEIIAQNSHSLRIFAKDTRVDLPTFLPSKRHNDLIIT